MALNDKTDADVVLKMFCLKYYDWKLKDIFRVFLSSNKFDNIDVKVSDCLVHNGVLFIHTLLRQHNIIVRMDVFVIVIKHRKTIRVDSRYTLQHFVKIFDLMTEESP